MDLADKKDVALVTLEYEAYKELTAKVERYEKALQHRPVFDFDSASWRRVECDLGTAEIFEELAKNALNPPPTNETKKGE